MCLIFLSLIAIIVIIGLSFTGKDEGKFEGVPKDYINETKDNISDLGNRRFLDKK